MLPLLALWPQAASSQPAPGPAPSGVVDVKSIDPDSYRALAARLPPGRAPRIDGSLNDEEWLLAPVQGNFVQREPRFGAPASERTEFRVLYDDRHIYIAVWAWDSDPSGILASELKRDSGLRKGDQIKINFDTFHDHRNAFYFSTNPLGAYKDANSVENGRTINYDWNAVWNNKTSIDDKGWYVEAAIPFSQLRFRSSVGEVLWGLNVCRIILRKNEEAYWVPFPREWGSAGFARMSGAGVLSGLDQLRARRRMEFVPYILPTATRDYVQQNAAARDAKFGGDFKIGITNELTADLTFHTDFAQVEADQEVVNLSRFSLFFPERRQFFTEGAGIFDYGKSASGLSGDAAASDPGLLALFYSRRIGLADGQEVPILGGGRVTGRVGQYALGVLNVSTEDATVRRNGVPGPMEGANFTVLRVKRNILSKSSIGGVLLNSAGGISDYNRAVGVDAGFFLGQNFTVIGLLAKTQSDDAVMARLPSEGAEMAGVVDVNYKTDRYGFGAQYQDVGARFNAEMGFIPRVDIRATKARAAWTPRPRWRGVRQMLFSSQVEYFEDHRGRVNSRTQSLEAQMQRQDTSSARVTLKREVDNPLIPFAAAGTSIVPGAYQWTTAQFNVVTNQARRVYGSATVDVGGFYNGERQSIQGAVNFIIGRTLLFEPNYTRNRITLPGRDVYTSNVLNVRVSHSFSPNLFLKGFAQFNDDRRTASFNFLFWYIYKPGSDLYIVFNQGWDANTPVPQHYNVRNRSLAVKMTYWLAR
ncbi:MAG: carbohydrate binding family 9 domain-containing protein [Acidobacteria bacterium]|nr:carbohydrate binding family 9 domain-containing protein [Acidobacteriota bacterium]